MNPGALLQHGREALLLSVAVSLPVLLAAMAVGLIVAAFQASAQIQDFTIGQLPRLLAVAAALVLLGPWIGSQIGTFAEQMFTLAAMRQ